MNELNDQNEHTLPDPEDFYDETGAIATDYKCSRCGYNVRGLRDDNRCPECGMPLEYSVHSDLLRCANPGWLNKVARGLTIVLWMILVGILATCSGGSMLPIFQSRVTLIALAVELATFYGYWLLTEPDPSGIGESEGLNARKFVRVAMAILVVGQLLPFAVGLGGLGPAQMLSLGCMVVCGTLVGLAGHFAVFIHLERLALRIPNQALADRAYFLRWAFAVLFVVGGIVLIIFLMAVDAGGRAPVPLTEESVLFVVIAIIIGLAFLIFSIMRIVLLLQLQNQIGNIAHGSRDGWTDVFAPADGIAL